VRSHCIRFSVGASLASHPTASPSASTARVAQVLAKHEVPIDMAKNNRNRVTMKRVAVRFLSMHTAKGLEFPCVAIAGLGFLGRHGEAIEECVRLTYVGVTRATHEALLTYSSESAL